MSVITTVDPVPAAPAAAPPGPVAPALPVAPARTRLRPRRGLMAMLARYATVSVIATVTSLTVLGVLVATDLATPGWANVIATCVGIVPSFELNRRWVWSKSGQRSLTRELVPFVALSLIGLGASTVAVQAAARAADQAGLSTLGRTLAVELANVAAFGSLWVVQFLVLDRILFRRRDPAV